MRTFRSTLALFVLAAALGCGSKDEEYKIEGPSAQGNPSVAGSANQPGAASGAFPTSGNKAGAPKPRGN